MITKPKLIKTGLWWWCYSYHASGSGATPSDAYCAWFYDFHGFPETSKALSNRFITSNPRKP